jgi:NADH-quinone oxidoreductase subunit M
MIDTMNLLLQSVLLPAIFAPVVLALGRRLGKSAGWIAFLPLAYATLIFIYVAMGIYTGSIDGNLYSTFEWAPFIGNFALLADGLSTPIALTIALLTTVISVYSIAYMEHEKNLGAYFGLYLLYAAGMIGTVLTTNLAAFFLFFELMLIPSWALIGIWGTGPREKIAFKYFMFTEAGALSLLAGIVAIGFVAGSFDIFTIAQRTSATSITLLTFIVVAMLIGLFVKMAVFPLHTWLPDAHAEAPTPISALLSPAMIGIGGYAAIRIVYTAFPRVIQLTQFNLAIGVLAVVTLGYGGIMAVAQSDMKRLLAYSSISQMGYLLFGLASVSVIGVAGAIVLYISHGLCKAVLFMVSGIFMHNYNTRDIGSLSGLAAKMPYTAIATLVSFLGLAGVPPLVGFWGEFYVFSGSIYSGLLPSLNMTRIGVTAVALIASILTAGYGLWTVRRVFYGEVGEHLKEAREGPKMMLVPMFVLVFLTVAFGIYPALIGKVVTPVAADLVGRLLRT